MIDQAVSRKLLTFKLKELGEAIKKYYPKSEKRVGEILVDMDVVEKDELRDGLEKQKGTEKRIGEILVKEGYVQKADLDNSLNAQQLSRTKERGG